MSAVKQLIVINHIQKTYFCIQLIAINHLTALFQYAHKHGTHSDIDHKGTTMY